MRSIRNGISARVVLALLVVALVALPQQGAGAAGVKHYAKPTGLSSGSCLTWGTACKLTRALSVAVVGDQIWAAKGIYRTTAGTDRTISFHLKNGVAIYGGFLGGETLLSQRNWTYNQTILSGDIGIIGTDNNDNAYHVVVGGTTSAPTNSSAVLDGFVVEDGYANGTGQYAWGAGIFNQSSSPTLRNLFIHFNNVGTDGSVAGGGGVANYASSPTLTNVNIWGNISYAKNSGVTYGAGMYNSSGSSPVLNRVYFHQNQATHGAGMYNASDSLPVIKNSLFDQNVAVEDGGAIFSYNLTLLKLTNVTFDQNSAAFGGALYNSTSTPRLENVTFHNNTATSAGGAIYNSLGGGTVVNSTFTGNTSPSGNALRNVSSTVYIYDSILWGDGATETSSDTGSAMTVQDSIVQGGCPAGSTCNPANVLNVDPVLGTLAAHGGWLSTMPLLAGSPAVDAGNPVTCTVKDARGVTRPQGPKCDMGAYEVQVKTFVSSAAYDGQVVESGENTSAGGTASATSGTIGVGDNALNRQVRGFLSFNTAGLPDTVTVVKAVVKVDKAGIVGDANPWSTHGQLFVDLRKPYFGTGLALAPADFQAAANIPATALDAPASIIYNTPSGSWYSGVLSDLALPYVNKTGTTQLRLRFTTDDDNDLQADLIRFYSGNAVTATTRPRLVVYYNP